ncbi:hypothetical protein [Pseudobacteriovorax antillogorgiicola]|uniref:Lipoprotein n=1 Tax=Pseudobacteriovorax antillogorgiicola TaxID=1513793 RepID=A0A1Y6CTL9_9BACT|nr:hypothetical protein [Pseudobacteriovorax antillogorgiicola]TCS44831.1 hypothetical protein EDD56_13160 [Pseudobacteriovorax antillogorgiicola]SMF77144.1 hypothetical protein SAMN06296036_1314 [Pseudobacteriovorax antillogorgiicola]
MKFTSRQSSGIPRMILPMVMLAGPGCGTQTGNPPSSGSKTKFADSSIATMMSLAYTETIDAINSGDYLFSFAESRVINEDNCNPPDTSLSLLKSTNTEHSVSISRDNRESRADLSIKRQYQDRWLQGTRQLECQAGGGLRLSPGTIKTGDSLELRSDVSETKSRQLTAVLLDSVTSQPRLEQFSSIEKSGQRQLRFTNLSDTSDLSTWRGTVQESIDRRLNFEVASENFSGPYESNLDIAPITFSFEIDKASGLLTRYRLDQQTVSFRFQNLGTVDLTFEDLVLEPSQGCFPVTGTIRADWRDVQGDLQSQVWTFRDGALVGSQNLKMLFTPEACVLNER